jgi:transposase
MPWKERSVMDERRRFVIRLKDGDSMASVCRQYGISRPMGYKIFERYEECGIEGLTDRSRRPYRYANSLPPQIVPYKKDKPSWGARKLRELLLRKLQRISKASSCSVTNNIAIR